MSFKLFISKYTDLDSVTGHFSFLGTESAFLGWNDESFGKLWSYNLNYMDYLHQETISFEQAVCWIDKFVDEIEGNRNGLEPYPIALRGINWIKFLSKYHPYILAENKRNGIPPCMPNIRFYWIIWNIIFRESLIGRRFLLVMGRALF